MLKRDNRRKREWKRNGKKEKQRQQFQNLQSDHLLHNNSARSKQSRNKQAVNGCVCKPEIAARTDLLHGKSVIILFSSALVDQRATRKQKDTTTTTSNVFVLQFSVNEQLNCTNVQQLSCCKLSKCKPVQTGKSNNNTRVKCLATRSFLEERKLRAVVVVG